MTPHRVGGPRRWWDWVLVTDPGLGQLQSGWRSFVAMVTGLAVGYGMSHALGIPSMIGMMVAGMMGLMSAFAIAENTWTQLTRSIMWMPFPFGAVLWLAASLHAHRAVEIALNATALALTFFLARFGKLPLLTGMMLFNGFMIGSIAGIPTGMVGKAFLAALVGAAGVLGTRLLLCYPMPREDLLRTQRAFVVEARRLADTAVDTLDPDADQQRVARRMSRSLRRLNVVTVTIDGRLAQPELAADPATTELLHRYLFDAELALRGIGQAVQDLSRLDPPAQLREALAVGLQLARDTAPAHADGLRPAVRMIRDRADAVLHDPAARPGNAEAAAVARRVADLLDSLAGSLLDWLTLGRNTPRTPAAVPFQPAVALENNRIPGSAGPAGRALSARSESGWHRAVPYLRAPLHAGVAAAIVCPIVDSIDPQRFYWGLVGVMITLFGTNTTHERLRKFGHRMVGTVAGAVIGVLLLHLIGRDHIYLTLTVIVLGISFGAWGMQRAYGYWVTGLVAALVQMYGMTTPDSGMDHLLGERLLDNGLGILVATACAALIFPLSSRAVVREAERGFVGAVEHLTTQVAARWGEPESPVRLRGAARSVEAALFQLTAVARPLVRMPLGVRGRGADNRVALLTTATGHVRALAAAADMDIDLSARLTERGRLVTTTLGDSLRALDLHLETGSAQHPWRRVSPLIRELENELRPAAPGPRARRLNLALRELDALDETLAAFAEQSGMAVETGGPAVPGQPGRTSPMQRRTRSVVAAWNQPRHPSLDGRPGTGERQDGAAVPAPARAPGSASPGAVPAGATAGEASGTARSVAFADGDVRDTASAAGAVTVAVSGGVLCELHPEGCPARLTVINARGQRVARGYAEHGRYRLDLRPGSHTLVVSAPDHSPRAETLTVRDTDRDVRHDIRL
ncbi:FUSC family protein [Streptomyces sp. NPDC090306]|uniref:FUSC family protein n=1 Tax=Streptomyces sp. NPDC090306 TaxID=3365961 RepID=UPI003830EDC6